LSDWLRDNKWVNIVAVIVIVILAWRVKAIIDALTGTDAEQSNSDVISDDTWFYDTGSGKLFRAPRAQIPPIKGPSGEDAVWATVHGCGGCGESQRFVAYMTSHTPQLKARAEADPGVKASLYAESCQGRLYSSDGKTWVAAENAQAAGMINASRNPCGGDTPKRCP